MGFDRYTQFKSGNGYNIIPFGEISKSKTDVYEIYRRGTVRLDQLSSQYYGSPDYAWLILQANPQYGSLEYNIPDGVELRIPYPLNSALELYQNSIDKYNKLYN